ncbi:MAG: outer membrane beta-barrel protein [Alphaproteobacteria bacterium]|nr:outer membrane beta-barrel protein [Alphaproteobacteria bacterium]
MKKTLTCITLCVAFTGVANAQTKQYVSGKIALVMPVLGENLKTRDNGDLIQIKQNTNMGMTPGFSAAFGAKFSDFRVEVESNMHASSSDKHDDVKISNTSILLNGYYDFPLSRKFWLYGGLGFGYNNAFMEISGTEDTDGIGIDLRGGGLAWQASAGVAFSLTNSLTADLGYRYFNGGRLSYSTIVDASEYVRYNTDVTYGEVKLGLRYFF